MINLLSIFEWILSTSLMASILVLLILIIRFFMRDKLNPRWQYMLWFLVFFRLLLPWTPQSSFSIFNIIHISGTENFLGVGQEIVLKDIGTIKGTIQDYDKIANISSGQANQSPLTTKQISETPAKENITNSTKSTNEKILNVLLIIWLLGSLFMAAYILIKNTKFMLLVKKDASKSEEKMMNILRECKDKMSIDRDIQILKTDAVASPSLHGLIKSKILLPSKSMEILDENEWRYIFIHELAHLKRKDIVVNCLITVLVIIHWFNPIIVYGFKKMQDDQEITCDNLALSIIGDKESWNYGYTMIKLLENCKNSLWKPNIASFSPNKSQIKRRIIMIKLFKNSAYKWSLIGLVPVILLAGITLTNGRSVSGKTNNNVLLAGPAKSAESSQLTDKQTAPSKIDEAETASKGQVTKSAFNHIYMVNNTGGWAVSNNAVYYTEDGSKTWTDITPNGAVLDKSDNVLASRFAYLDENNGFLAVSQENTNKVTIYKTSDSGQHWNKAEASNTYSNNPFIKNIYFTDKDHGWLLLSYGVAMGSERIDVYRTTDGGNTWKKTAGTIPETAVSSSGLPFGGHKTGLSFLDENNGFITGFDYGNELYLYATHDGGTHWQRQSLQIAKGYKVEAGSAQTMAPKFFSTTEGLMPVIYNNEGQSTFFYSTKDGGKTWQINSTPLTSSINNQFVWSFIDSLHGFAADGNTLYVTKDGAKSWKKITYDVKELQNITMLDFVDENNGWALGNDFLLRTNDGGKTWVKTANTNN